MSIQNSICKIFTNAGQVLLQITSNVQMQQSTLGQYCLHSTNSTGSSNRVACLNARCIAEDFTVTWQRQFVYPCCGTIPARNNEDKVTAVTLKISTALLLPYHYRAIAQAFSLPLHQNLSSTLPTPQEPFPPRLCLDSNFGQLSPPTKSTSCPFKQLIIYLVPYCSEQYTKPQ